MNTHLCGVNAFVAFFLTCSLKPNASCVPLGEMQEIGVLDPAKIPQRESKNDCVDLVSRRNEADDGMWVGHNEALDKTMTATGSRTVNGKAISYIDIASPTELMWPMRCLFGRSVCQLFLCWK